VSLDRQSDRLGHTFSSENIPICQRKLYIDSSVYNASNQLKLSRQFGPNEERGYSGDLYRFSW